MKVAIASVQVPFITGGAEVLARDLCDQLVARGHQAAIVTVPFKWYPIETLLDAMAAGGLVDLSEVNGERIDRVIALKFPAYYLRHDRKVLWLCHQHRQAYDLWGTPHGDLHLHPRGEAVRRLIVRSDNEAFAEARAIYTIGRNVAERLRRFNDVEATVLHPPPRDADRLRCDGYEDFVFFPSRLDPMKRQRLLVEAARHLGTPARIVLAGAGSDREVTHLTEMVTRHGLSDRVRLLGFVSDEEKVRLYATCLAVYYGAVDEDYGYVPVEAMLASKAVLVHPDAGGPAEFVTDGESGFVVSAEPEAIARQIDALWHDRALARAMGERARASIAARRIDWDHVIGRLLGEADA